MGFLRKLIPSPMNEPIIIVSGLPRSGTSMMMKMLEAGGIPPLTDEIREADKDNPEGYYEFERVKKLDKGDVAWLEDAQGKAVKVISALLKHLPSGHEYRVIFLHRRMSEILASQRKMLIHRGEDADGMDDEKMALLFEKHLQSVQKWLNDQPNITTLEIHYSDILSDPSTENAKINAFLSQKLDVVAMARIVNPALYRNRDEEWAP